MKDYRNTSSRIWHIICYDKRVVDAIVEASTRSAYILHDKDVYTEDSDKHKKGDIKGAHYHIYSYRRNDTKGEFFIRLASKVAPDNDGCRVAVQTNGHDAVEYFQHADEKSVSEGKTAYKCSDIVFDAKGYDQHFKSLEERQAEQEAKQADAQDKHLAFINDLLVYHKRPYEMVKRHGKSYITARSEMSKFATELICDMSLPLDELSEEAQKAVIDARSEMLSNSRNIPNFEAGRLLLDMVNLRNLLRKLPVNEDTLSTRQQAVRRLHRNAAEIRRLSFEAGYHDQCDAELNPWYAMSFEAHCSLYDINAKLDNPVNPITTNYYD